MVVMPQMAQLLKLDNQGAQRFLVTKFISTDQCSTNMTMTWIMFYWAVSYFGSGQMNNKMQFHKRVIHVHNVLTIIINLMHFHSLIPMTTSL